MKPFFLLSLLLAFALFCSISTAGDFKPLGDLVALSQIPDAQLVSNITLVASINANQAGTLDIAGFRYILERATPASPDIAKSWQFADWYHGSFVQSGKTNFFTLYLGGLGLLSQPDGTRGLFSFKQPTKEKP